MEQLSPIHRSHFVTVLAGAKGANTAPQYFPQDDVLDNARIVGIRVYSEDTLNQAKTVQGFLPTGKLSQFANYILYLYLEGQELQQYPLNALVQELNVKVPYKPLAGIRLTSRRCYVAATTSQPVSAFAVPIEFILDPSW